MFRPFLLSLALCLASLLSHAETLAWRNVNIGGGGFVTGIVSHPGEYGLRYCRTDVGGAYRWDEQSQTWIALNDDLGQADSQLLGILSVAVDRRDTSKVYLAAGQYLPSWGHYGAIFRSSDRGQTWSRTDLNIRLGGNSDGRSAGERLQVDPNLGSILFLGTNQDGLWKSTDGGATWAKVSSFTLSSVSTVAFDSSSGTVGSATQRLYVGADVSSGSTLWVSNDGGATWNTVSGTPSGLRPYQMLVDSGILYVTWCNTLGPNSVTSGAVTKLNISSGVWTTITPPAGQGGFAGLSLAGSTLVVSTLDRWSPRDEIYRSTDGGTTWKGILISGTLDHSLAPYAGSLTPHWIGDVYVDPLDPKHILFVTGYGLYETFNANAVDSSGTVAWSFQNAGVEECVPSALACPTSGAKLVSVIYDFDGFYHTDTAIAPSAGRHSPNIGSTEDLAFAWSTPSAMARIGNSTGQYSTTGGKTWTAFASIPSVTNGVGKIAVSTNGLRHLWAPAQSVPYLSTNNGGTWTASTGVSSPGTNSLAVAADTVNASKFYLYNRTTATTQVSNDGGASFSTSATGLPAASANLRCTPGVEGHVWIALWGYGLYRSTDSSATFSKVSSVQDAYKLGFGKAADGASYPTLFLWGKVSGTEGLFRSIDNAATWTRVDDDAHRFGYLNDLTGDPNTYGRVYLATGGRGIMVGEISTPPVITTQPLAQQIALGSTLDLSVTATNATGYQWFKDDSALLNGTTSNLSIEATTTADLALYHVIVTGPGGSTTSEKVRIGSATARTNRLTNISTRAPVSANKDPMIAGFVISGTQNKRVLIRANGPALGYFQMTGLADPRLILYKGSTVLATNEDWPGTAEYTALFNRLGAYSTNEYGGWTPGSRDAALYVSLPPGAYTAFLVANADEGIAMVEVYDADPVPGASQLTNISTRSDVSTGNDVQIVGFVIAGNANNRRVLIRSLGPALGLLGVSATLADPYMELYGSGRLITSNDNWPSTIEYTNAFAATGAYAENWLPASKDAAMIQTLAPGAYSAIIRGQSSGTGAAMIEVYDYP